MNISVKQKQTHRQVVAKGEGREGRIRSLGPAVYGEWINNKVPLHNTRNYTQCSVINHNGEDYEKDLCVCVCVCVCVCMYN